MIYFFEMKVFEIVMFSLTTSPSLFIFFFITPVDFSSLPVCAVVPSVCWK